MRPGYFRVTLSVDALGWTRHWLPEERCDLLVVDIAKTSDQRPPICFTAVESKTRTTEDEIDCDERAEPFKKGKKQVEVTLDAIETIFTKDDDLISDLKRSALIQQVISEVLSRAAGEDDIGGVIIRLNDLSRRDIKADSVELNGVVVLTQPNVTVDLKEKEVEYVTTADLTTVPIRLIRCGIPTVRKIFKAEIDTAGADAEVIVANDEDRDTETLVDSVDVIVGDDEDSDVAVAVDSADDDVIPDDDLTPDDDSGRDEADNEPAELSEATTELISALEGACLARKFQIEDVDLSLVKEGSTLVSVPVGYAVGAPLSVIQRATKDIARDIGVGEDVEVDNDPEHAGHIRFLLPKKDRKFPLIPTVKTLGYDADGNGKYLGIWLGEQVDGTPYRSFVSEWPHLLLGGTTGSGKTTFLRSILGQLNEAPDKNVTIAIIDGKGDFDYDGVIDDDRFPKKDEFRDVLIGAESVLPVMEWLVNEEINERRQKIRAYLEKHKNAGRSPKRAYVRSMNKHGVREPGETGTTKFPISPIIIVIDEFAQLMTTTGPDARQFANLVQQVVQMGRSALVHLLLATQRPDATVVPGTIKANLPSRIGMKLPGHQDSSVILGETGAEKLLGLGDLIFKSAAGERIRLQGFNLAEEE